MRYWKMIRRSTEKTVTAGFNDANSSGRNANESERSRVDETEKDAVEDDQLKNGLASRGSDRKPGANPNGNTNKSVGEDEVKV